MSESLKLIYKILKILEKSMDYSELDVDRLSPEALGTSLNRRNAILEMLLKKGYIDGITVKKYVNEESSVILGLCFQRGLFQTPWKRKRKVDKLGITDDNVGEISEYV